MVAALALACAGAGCEARAADGGSAGVSANPGDDVTAPPPTRVGVTVPPGWAALPEVAGAGLAGVDEAMRARTVVRAWGEPSLGCFATVVEIAGSRNEHMARVAETFRATMASGAQVDGWTFADATGEVTATITRGVLHGSVRGRMATDVTGAPHGAFLACFYNEREPARCQAACADMLASLEPPKVSS